MRRSIERILTTHVGSLIRPEPLLPFIRARQSGQPYDERAYRACLASSVAEVVRGQGPFHRRVHPSIMWAKLETLAAGARLASKELWN